jgi:hypothetical protein
MDNRYNGHKYEATYEIKDKSGKSVFRKIKKFNTRSGKDKKISFVHVKLKKLARKSDKFNVTLAVFETQKDGKKTRHSYKKTFKPRR